jgi:hypothetical protein
MPQGSASVTRSQLPLHPVNQHPRPRRPQTGSPAPAIAGPKTGFSERQCRRPCCRPPANAGGDPAGRPVKHPLPLVEVNGIEPMTSCLQSRRSPN